MIFEQPPASGTPLSPAFGDSAGKSWVDAAFCIPQVRASPPRLMRAAY